MPDCWSVLGLADSPLPRPAEVKARWRELAACHHPDRGGDGARFAALSVAYEEALALASAPRPCPTCNGSGKQMTAYGWSAVALPCAACGGAGEEEA